MQWQPSLVLQHGIGRNRTWYAPCCRASRSTASGAISCPCGTDFFHTPSVPHRARSAAHTLPSSSTACAAEHVAAPQRAPPAALVVQPRFTERIAALHREPSAAGTAPAVQPVLPSVPQHRVGREVCCAASRLQLAPDRCAADRIRHRVLHDDDLIPVPA